MVNRDYNHAVGELDVPSDVIVYRKSFKVIRCVIAFMMTNE